MNRSHLTSFGVPGLSAVPYGVHICQFYHHCEDLMDALYPYFLAGLNANERCLWIAAKPLPALAIREELTKNRTFARALESGQITVMDASEWYGPLVHLTAAEVIGNWFVEEDKALAADFNGLRITGNTSFVSSEYWSAFMEYEEKLHELVHDRRLVVCCSYDIQRCKPVDLLEVVQRHHGALERSKSDSSGWEVLRPESAALVQGCQTETAAEPTH